MRLTHSALIFMCQLLLLHLIVGASGLQRRGTKIAHRKTDEPAGEDGVSVMAGPGVQQFGDESGNEGEAEVNDAQQPGDDGVSVMAGPGVQQFGDESGNEGEAEVHDAQQAGDDGASEMNGPEVQQFSDNNEADLESDTAEPGGDLDEEEYEKRQKDFTDEEGQIRGWVEVQERDPLLIWFANKAKPDDQVDAPSSDVAGEEGAGIPGNDESANGAPEETPGNEVGNDNLKAEEADATTDNGAESAAVSVNAETGGAEIESSTAEVAGGATTAAAGIEAVSETGDAAGAATEAATSAAEGSEAATTAAEGGEAATTAAEGGEAATTPEAPAA